MALRAATTAGFSVGIARPCGLAYPIYALLAAVIVTDLSPSRTRKLGRQRLVATVAGAGYVSGIVMVAHGANPWSYAFLRLIETVLGILLAWLTSFV